MVHTAQRGKVYEVIIFVVLFLLFASGFKQVWVVVSQGIKVDFVKSTFAWESMVSISEKAIKK